MESGRPVGGEAAAVAQVRDGAAGRGVGAMARREASRPRMPATDSQ